MEQLWLRSPFLPWEGSAPAPAPSLSAGVTHQLWQEEGIGDGEEQGQPWGHIRWRMAGGGRWVGGGHARTLPGTGLPSSRPAARQISPPA